MNLTEPQVAVLEAMGSQWEAVSALSRKSGISRRKIQPTLAALYRENYVESQDPGLRGKHLWYRITPEGAIAFMRAKAEQEKGPK